MSRHLLTNQEEEALINQATLEALLRDPQYPERHADDRIALVATRERQNWTRLYPTDEDKAYALPYPAGWWEDEFGLWHPPSVED